MSWGAQWEGFDEKPDTTKRSDTTKTLVKVSATETSAAFDFTGADLGELATYANKWHDEIVGDALEAAWHAGQALNAAKAQMTKRGDFTPWLTVNFRGSRQTAYDYMRIAAAGGCPADVVKFTTNADGTTKTQPSINAALKAIAKRNKKDPAPPKSSTIFNRWCKRLDTVAGQARTEMPNHLGHLTATAAEEVAVKMRGWIDVLEDLYSLVAEIADEPDKEQGDD